MNLSITKVAPCRDNKLCQMDRGNTGGKEKEIPSKKTKPVEIGVELKGMEKKDPYKGPHWR